MPTTECLPKPGGRIDILRHNSHGRAAVKGKQPPDDFGDFADKVFDELK
jgi:hypothetical protein